MWFLNFSISFINYNENDIPTIILMLFICRDGGGQWFG